MEVKKKFRIKILEGEKDGYFDLSITRNGWQWSSNEYTLGQLKVIAREIHKFISSIEKQSYNQSKDSY